MRATTFGRLAISQRHTIAANYRNVADMLCMQARTRDNDL